MADHPPHRVMMLAFADYQILDVVGPLQMLAGANEKRPEGATPYAIELIAEEAGPVRSNGGLGLLADRGFGDVTARDLKSVDTFMISGGQGTRGAIRNTKLLDFVRRASEAAPRVVSICTGSIILAAAGVLGGKRATTHWSATQFLRRYAEVEVEPDAIYVRDGKVWSSAGVTTGMDLAIALIEEDMGRATALAVAREHVLFMMRPGGQSQFSAELAAQEAAGRTAKAVRYVAANLTRDLRAPALAEAAGMSERTLLRAFRDELGTTPADFVQRVRVDAARRRLSAATPAPVERVAAACGFASAETMRRAFQRELGVSPADYRARFATAQRAPN